MKKWKVEVKTYGNQETVVFMIETHFPGYREEAATRNKLVRAIRPFNSVLGVNFAVTEGDTLCLYAVVKHTEDGGKLEWGKYIP